MKKFLATLFATWCLTASIAFAYGYPRFWKGDTNYPLVWGHMGGAWYLDKSSIKVKLNDPPYYIITAQTILIHSSDYSPGEEKYSNDKEASDNMDYEFFYDEDEMDMRIGYPATNRWRYLGPLYSNAESGRSMHVGEATFYVALGRKFYGNYLWKSEYKDDQGKDKYWEAFTNDFYTDL